MKNILVVIWLLSLQCCVKEKIVSTTIFEHSIMKPWFNAHCASCHATGKSNYLLWHYNPNDYYATFSKHTMSQIYQLVYVDKRMPKDKKLSNDEIMTFKNWYDAGFAAK